jgi:hypothetical protein
VQPDVGVRHKITPLEKVRINEERLTTIHDTKASPWRQVGFRLGTAAAKSGVEQPNSGQSPIVWGWNVAEHSLQLLSESRES